MFWRKMRFSGFSGKIRFFAVLAENLHFLRFWREIFFDGKCVLTKRCVFENLMGKYNPSGCNIIMYKTNINLHLHPDESPGWANEQHLNILSVAGVRTCQFLHIAIILSKSVFIALKKWSEGLCIIGHGNPAFEKCYKEATSQSQQWSFWALIWKKKT